MGRVYLAERGGVAVAVKVISPELVMDDAFRARFRREVAAAQAVQGACTARVLDADVNAESPYLVTEYLAGQALSERVARSGPLTDVLLQSLSVGLAEGVTALEAAGLVHRDLKPANVILTADGPKVIDFGIAYAAEATALTLTAQSIGTAGYLAPEQVTGGQITSRTDVFAWGATVAFAATGRPPFGHGRAEALLFRVLHQAPVLTGVPAELLSLVTDALSKDPSCRPCPQQLLSRLKQVEELDAATAEQLPSRLPMPLATATRPLPHAEPLSATTAAPGRGGGTLTRGQRAVVRLSVIALVASVTAVAVAGNPTSCLDSRASLPSRTVNLQRRPAHRRHRPTARRVRPSLTPVGARLQSSPRGAGQSRTQVVPRRPVRRTAPAGSLVRVAPQALMAEPTALRLRRKEVIRSRP